ncbi:hypothetical protein BCR42DRAFT_441117 [Absidia repens]|uniref:AhpD-like protein n=1 Tax=Absidia repens TaxID=90262 RepID=A0A1X2I6M6_9FUNG|nr:hypothetical protein BCR42DRAFT_441117 [Absidia repens]
MSLIDALNDIRRINHVDQATSQNYLSKKWLLIAPLVINGLNRPEDLYQVYELVSQDIDAMENMSADEKLSLKAKVVAKQCDALLKGMVAFGYPKTIVGTFFLNKMVPSDVRDRLPKESIRKDDCWENIAANRYWGELFFGNVYGANAEKSKSILNEINPDLRLMVMNNAYASPLSETSVTSAKESCMILVAGCFATQVFPIMKGHIIGAKSHGVSEQELDEIFESLRILAQFYDVRLTPVPDLSTIPDLAQ